MPMTVEQLREEIISLPFDQRQELMDSVWIADPKTETGLHPTVAAELDRRMASYYADPSSAIPWEDTEQELRDLIDKP